MDEGTDHTVFLRDTGIAYAIGENTYGQLGNGTNNPSTELPVAVLDETGVIVTDIKEIKAGDYTTVLVKNDETVYAFGMNDNYELGTDDPDILDYNKPIENTGITDVISVGIGDNHVTAIKSDGFVYSWGQGSSGQLGNRNNKKSKDPVIVGDYAVRADTSYVVLEEGEEREIKAHSRCR